MGKHMKVKLEELTKEQKFEIIESYKTAKDQNAQIRILAELNDCTPLTIRKVLREAGIDDHENDGEPRFSLRESKGAGEAENAKDEKQPPEIISVSCGPFYRAEAILALMDPADDVALKERAVELILTLVEAATRAVLFGRVQDENY